MLCSVQDLCGDTTCISSVVLLPCCYFMAVERAKVPLYPLCVNFWNLMFFRWSCIEVYLNLDLGFAWHSCDRCWGVISLETSEAEVWHIPCRVQVHKVFVKLQVNLLNMLPEVDRTKDRLSEILEDRGLTFLFPLLRIQSELWKQLQADPNPTQFYKWIKENLDPSHHTNAGFINALMTVLVKYITQVN